MKTFNLMMRGALLSAFLIFSLSLSSQEKAKQSDFQPEVGQEGKDVVWVPTPQALVDKMLELGKAKPGDLLIDLGSGDGRTVITAAKRGIRAMGIEYNPDMVELSQKNAKAEGVEKLAEFIQGDLFEADFSKATILTMFLLPDINLRLRPIILDMKPGTRVVTNTFTMQEWKWDETANIDDEESSWSTCYLWIVPAKVEGRWRIDGDGEIVFLQEFQFLSGELTLKNKKEKISEGRLRGDVITFTSGDTVYEGKVNGNTMEGTCVRNGKISGWRAMR